MEKVIIASSNKGKLKEIKEILKNFQYEIMSMKEIGFEDEIEETGETFEENALIKAMAIYKYSKCMVIADDSGLVVDALNGAPGIYSARFAGENATDNERNNKLLELLKGVNEEKRTARFVCAIAVVYPNGNHFVVRGECEGIIAKKEQGENGFGYDPLFYIPEFGITTAQMKPKDKHNISHRGKALQKMLKKLEENKSGNSSIK